MPLNSCEDVLGCLPPMVPGQPGFLGNDGEHLCWFNPSAPGQTPVTGPNGDIAWINQCAAVEHCTQTPFMKAMLEQNAKIAEALRLLAEAATAKPKAASKAKKP